MELPQRLAEAAARPAASAEAHPVPLAIGVR
jgi:hypothetical protein